MSVSNFSSTNAMVESFFWVGVEREGDGLVVFFVVIFC